MHSFNISNLFLSLGFIRLNFQIPANVTSQLGIFSIYCRCESESSNFITCKPQISEQKTLVKTI